MLTVRRFDNDRIKRFRVLAVREEKRTIVKVQCTAADNKRVVVRFQYCRPASKPFFTERFTADPAVRQQAHSGRDLNRLEAALIERAANWSRDRGADACIKSFIDCVFIDDRYQNS